MNPDAPDLREQWHLNPLAVGRLVVSKLDRDELPGWAADVLFQASSMMPRQKEVDDLLEVTADNRRWREAYDLFLELRQRRLAESRPEVASFIDLAENVAKIVYNASGAQAPFDRNVDLRLSDYVKRFTDVMGQDELTTRIFDALTAPIKG